MSASPVMWDFVFQIVVVSVSFRGILCTLSVFEVVKDGGTWDIVRQILGVSASTFASRLMNCFSVSDRVRRTLSRL